MIALLTRREGSEFVVERCRERPEQEKEGTQKREVPHVSRR